MLTCEKVFVAFSGGLDSTVLLHMLWQQQLPVHAVHINHQLQAQSDQWAQHCLDICQQWQIPCTVTKVDAKKSAGESPEAAARVARYAVFKELLTTDTVMCTAHHQDDQAETVLLQLLRGAGVAGLAAMPTRAPLGAGFMIRPLLDYTRAELQGYAHSHQLKWIDDPSNQNTDFDRNYLRHEIIPRLRERWPSASQTIARSAQHCASAVAILMEVVKEDYSYVTEDTRVDINKLALLPFPRQQYVLRYWIEQCGLTLPSSAQLEQIQIQLLQSRIDANPLVHWQGGCVRRYRDHLYAQKFIKNLEVKHIILSWDLQQPLCLPENLGTLTALLVEGQGMSAQKLQQAPITIRFRQGGERCQPAGRQHSQVLKKLLQEYGIPTWQRDHIPLLYCGDELAAVLGYWICAPFAAQVGEKGWSVF